MNKSTMLLLEKALSGGTVKKKITSVITFKGYTVHASQEKPQYLIKSDTTDHHAQGIGPKETQE